MKGAHSTQKFRHDVVSAHYISEHGLTNFEAGPGVLLKERAKVQIVSAATLHSSQVENIT